MNMRERSASLKGSILSKESMRQGVGRLPDLWWWRLFFSRRYLNMRKSDDSKKIVKKKRKALFKGNHCVGTGVSYLDH